VLLVFLLFAKHLIFFFSLSEMCYLPRTIALLFPFILWHLILLLFSLLLIPHCL
jgi:hypothetical protein